MALDAVSRLGLAPTPGSRSRQRMVELICRLVEVLVSRVAEIEADISALIKAEPQISHDAQLMRSLPGVGPVACMQLIAQMPELGHVGPKQAAALAGLAPFNVDRGAYAASSRIRGGRKRVRNALYMAALNAVPPRRSLQGLLRKAAKGRQTGKARPHCRRQKALDHPQRHHARQESLHAGSTNITVAGSRLSPHDTYRVARSGTRELHHCFGRRSSPTFLFTNCSV